MHFWIHITNIACILFWQGDKSGSYSVRTEVNMLEGNTSGTASQNLLWSSLVPPKECFFAWKVWQGKNLTEVLLKRRGFSWQADAPSVVQPKKRWIISYSTAHLNGVFTRHFFNFRSAWVCPWALKDLFLCWNWIPCKREVVDFFLQANKKLWMDAPLCLIQAIWKEINQVVLDNMFFLILE